MNLPEITSQKNLAQSWLQFVDVREQSRRTYQKALEKFFTYLKSEGISCPKREDVIHYRDQLLKVEELRPSTVQVYLVALKLFFRWLASRNLYPNISEDVKGVKLDGGFHRDFLTSEQAQKILSLCCKDTLKGKRDFALLRLLLTTGMRTIEASRANLEDLQTVSGQTVLYIQGKGRDDRNEFVKIAPKTFEALKDYLQARTDGQQPLFVSTSHNCHFKRISTRAIRGIVKDYMRAAGYDSPRLSAHSLRHTAATSYLRQGATIEAVRAVLRHKSLNTTLIYTHQLDRFANNCEFLADAYF